MLEGLKKRMTEVLGVEKDMFEGLGEEAKALVDELRPIIDTLGESLLFQRKFTLEVLVRTWRKNSTMVEGEIKKLLLNKLKQEKKEGENIGEQDLQYVESVVNKLNLLNSYIRPPDGLAANMIGRRYYDSE